MKNMKITVYHQEKDGNCGPAALRILMSHHGIRAVDESLGEELFVELIQSSPETGTSAREIVTAARKLGFESFYRSGCSWEKLTKEVDRSPAIVDWYSGIDKAVDGHYSVAIEATNKRIVLADPEYGVMRQMPREFFEAVWFDYKGQYPKRTSDFNVRRMITVRGPRDQRIELPKGFVQSSDPL
jgi:predicted double-glycine peptidase